MTIGRHARMGIALAALVTAATLRPAAAPLLPPGPADKTPSAQVLFIGNSLTVANNLTGMIEAIAAQAGLKGRIRCRAVAFPDFGLQEHWEQGDALRAIERERWTHVVLQQGPSSLPESERVLREFTRKFAFEAKAKGATVALYMVWPPRSRSSSFDAVRDSYAHAAIDVGGMLVPVGEGWRAAWRLDPTLPLYGPDDFHPSPMGTYLAALMFFERLTGRSPMGLPGPDASSDRALRDVRLTAAQLRILQAVAVGKF